MHDSKLLQRHIHYSYYKQLKLLPCWTTFMVSSSIHNHQQIFFKKTTLNYITTVTVWCWQILWISFWVYSSHFKKIYTGSSTLLTVTHVTCKKWPIWPRYADWPDLFSMLVYVHVCLCVCMCVCVCVFKCVYVCKCVYACVYVCVHVQVVL